MKLLSHLCLAIALFGPIPLASGQSLQASAPINARGRDFVYTHLAPAGAFGPVHVYNAVDGLPVGGPPELSDVRLLPIDFCGRTQVESLMADRPRRTVDVSGASRLVLPAARGSLYHYERLRGQEHRFGFLFLGARGQYRLLAERAGVGAGGLVNPFGQRVAIGPRAARMLVTTTLEAGGDLYEVDIVSGGVAERTSALAPQMFASNGLWLAADWGFAVTGTGVLRFERATATDAVSVPFEGGTPAYFSGEAVVSRNREHALTSAGAGPAQLRAWVFGRTGAARAAATRIGPMASAGFLPEHLDGPYMAVSDDGTQVGWREDSGLVGEAFYARVQQPAVQITADEYQADTLDAVGILGFFIAGRLTFAVGERADQSLGGVDKLDLFAVNDTGSGLAYSNLTLTSGDATAPFEALSELSPQGLTWVPEVEEFVFANEESETLLRSDLGGGGTTLLLAGVKELDWVASSNGTLLLSLRRSFQPKPHELWTLDVTFAGPLTPLLTGVDDIEFFDPVFDGAGRAAVVQRAELIGDDVLLLDLGLSTVASAFGQPVTIDGPLGYSPQGNLLGSERLTPAQSRLYAWKNGTAQILPTPATPARFLPAH